MAGGPGVEDDDDEDDDDYVKDDDKDVGKRGGIFCQEFADGVICLAKE